MIMVVTLRCILAKCLPAFITTHSPSQLLYTIHYDINSARKFYVYNKEQQLNAPH